MGWPEAGAARGEAPVMRVDRAIVPRIVVALEGAEFFGCAGGDFDPEG